LTDRASLRYDAYSASKLQDRLNEAGARLSMVFLDACRNNGFGGSRSAGGLAPMNPAHGSFIAFATGPGKTADDNPNGRNGLFTGILLETLGRPGLELTDIFREVRARVGTVGGPPGAVDDLERAGSLLLRRQRASRGPSRRRCIDGACVMGDGARQRQAGGY
jgi:uncharacterized caspase-like protein